MKRPYPDLRTWRSAKGWTTIQAAEFLGISQAFYSRLELGHTVVVRDKAKRIVELTNVPLETLVGVA